MNMNRDILKGKWLEIKGRVMEKWGKLTYNDLGKIEGKNMKLLGLLQKKHGYIRDKATLEYEDSIELAEIVTNLREIMKQKKDGRTIAFIARYGKPLLGKKQEIRITKETNKNGYDTDCYSYSRLSRRTAHRALYS